MEDKKEIPRISSSSGLSLDYMLCLGSIKNFIERVNGCDSNRSIFLAVRSIKDRKIPKYAEKFNPEEYKSPITKENRRTVEELDSLVEVLNKGKSDLTFNMNYREKAEEFSKVYNKIYGIVLHGLNGGD